jgi:hypothetical protein
MGDVGSPSEQEGIKASWIAMTSTLGEPDT